MSDLDNKVLECHHYNAEKKDAADHMSIEVDDKFFEYLTRKSADAYVMYKGVKVYCSSRKANADILDSMEAEQHYEYTIKTKPKNVIK